MCKLPLRFILMVSAVAACLAQASYVKDWEVLYPSDISAMWNRVLLDSDDSIYVVGSATTSKAVHFRVEKRLSSGDPGWVDERVSPTTGSDRASDLALGTSGDLYVVGKLDREFIVTRYDRATGDIDWTTSLGRGSGNSIAFVDGSIYVTGEVSSAWLTAKLDEFGNVLWQHSINGSGYDYGNDVVASATAVYSLGKLTNNPTPMARTFSLEPSSGNVIWVSDPEPGFSEAEPGSLILMNGDGVASQTRVVANGVSESVRRQYENTGTLLRIRKLISNSLALNMQSAEHYVVSATNSPQNAVAIWEAFRFSEGPFDIISIADNLGGIGKPVLAKDGTDAMHLVCQIGPAMKVSCNHLFDHLGSGQYWIHPPLVGVLDATDSPDVPKDAAFDSHDDLIVVGTSGSQAMILKIRQNPSAYDDFIDESNPNQTVYGNVFASDFGYRAGTLAVSHPPDHGSVALGVDGSFIYAPATGFAGTDGFYYTITKRGHVAEAKVHFRVAPKLLSLILSNTSILGGARFRGTIKVELASNAAAAVSLLDNLPYVEVPDSMFIPVGLASVDFNGSSSPVTATAIAQITVSNIAGSKTANLELRPGLLTNFTIFPSSVVGGNNAEGIVTLSAAAAKPEQISLSDNSSSIGSPESVIVQAGSSSAKFNIFTAVVSTSALRNVTALQGSVKKTANLKLDPMPVLSELSVSPTTVKGGVSAVGTVTTQTPASGGGVNIALGANSSAIQLLPAVFLRSGANTVSFSVDTSIVTATYVRRISATLGAVTKYASLTLTP